MINVIQILQKKKVTVLSTLALVIAFAIISSQSFVAKAVDVSPPSFLSFSRGGNTYTNVLTTSINSNSYMIINSHHDAVTTHRVQGTVTLTPLSGGPSYSRGFINSTASQFYWLDDLAPGTYKVSIQGYSIGTAPNVTGIEFIFHY